MKTKVLSLLIIFLSAFVFAQEESGTVIKVTDYQNNPLTNIKVYLGSTEVPVVINKRGFFKIEIPETTKEINIYSPQLGLLSSPYSGQNKLNFVYVKPDGDTDQAVESSYGLIDENGDNQNSKDFKMSEEPDIAGFNNIYDYIRGKVAGVTVTNGNRIVIRGIKSLSGSNSALLVVNGMPTTDISFINVNEIKKIKVLKDGASIYGSRGANGVLEITLK